MENPVLQIKDALIWALKKIDPDTDVFFEEIKSTDPAHGVEQPKTWYTIAHFLNSGKWDESLLSDTLKRSVIEIIYSEAALTGKPVFCIVDDMIAAKTKPSSRALHPIEYAISTSPI